MNYTFRLYDFNISNRKIGNDEEDAPYADDEEDDMNAISKQLFNIQMFGLNEHGETCSIMVEDYTPFFYVKIPPSWTENYKLNFQKHLEEKMGPYYKNTIVACSIIKRKKLYGFDGGKEHKFIIIKFTNLSAFNKAKNLWYYNATDKNGESERRLSRNGYRFMSWQLELYEANIPPLLRFFHINEISPSGWIMLQSSQCELSQKKQLHAHMNLWCIIKTLFHSMTRKHVFRIKYVVLILRPVHLMEIFLFPLKIIKNWQ